MSCPALLMPAVKCIAGPAGRVVMGSPLISVAATSRAPGWGVKGCRGNPSKKEEKTKYMSWERDILFSGQKVWCGTPSPAPLRFARVRFVSHIRLLSKNLVNMLNDFEDL